MAIEFKEIMGTHHIILNGEQVGYICKFQSTEQYHLKLHINVRIDQLEQIFTKMKELQGENK